LRAVRFWKALDDLNVFSKIPAGILIARVKPKACTDRLGTMMIDENLARIRTHRNKIARYWQLLRSELSDSKRSSTERRLAEERASSNASAAETFPHAITPTARRFQASAA
jgi:hypothetical protein